MRRYLAALLMSGLFSMASLQTADAFNPTPDPGSTPPPPSSSPSSPAPTPSSSPSSVPEIDANSAAIGLALAAGMLLIVGDRFVLRRRES